MNVSEHTARVFDTDLIKLTQLVAQMGGFAQKQITDSIDALTRRDIGLARQVIAADATVDALQRQIEEKAIATIALRQPMAIDLRALVAMLRIANDLERVGDLAKNIGKRVIAVSGDNSQRTLMRGLKHMAALVVSQLAAVLDSFVDRNPNKALQVWRADKEVDALYVSLFRELLTYSMEDPAPSRCASIICSAPRTSSALATTPPTSPRRCTTWSRARPSPASGPKATLRATSATRWQCLAKCWLKAASDLSPSLSTHSLFAARWREPQGTLPVCR